MEVRPTKDGEPSCPHVIIFNGRDGSSGATCLGWNCGWHAKNRWSHAAAKRDAKAHEAWAEQTYGAK